MNVPLLDVKRQNAPLEEELREAFARVLASGRFIQGPEVERFEEAAAAIAGARFAVGMSSGTDALLAGLMAVGVGPGDEVICPAYTFLATGGCVARLGARPVFADSLPGSFNVDPAAVERLVTPRTKAIIPVHLFGQAADMDEILEIASRRGLRVVEDAAQAFGASYRGREVGALGDCGAISFYPSKNLGALGDAGLVVTNDADLAARVRQLRNHGAADEYIHPVVGGNFRLDAVQAAFLSVKLPHLPEYTAARQRNACEYHRRLAVLDGAGLSLPQAEKGRTHIMNQYTVRVPGRRNALRDALRERGIATAVYYPVPLHLQQCFAAHGPHAPLPVAEMLAAEALSLPIFPELTGQELAAVADAVLAFFGASA